jgi:WS/DGAT/MGAT family acyltransferase
MKQLGILDAAFINLEQTNTPQHVGGMGIYDPSTAPGGFVRFKDVIAGFERRLGSMPLFRTRLVEVPGGLDRPYWVKDANFDVEFHLRHIALPEPGDWRQLCIQVARLHSRPLDMSRPLWEAYIIEGLDNIPNLPKGCFAVYTKMHHSLVDGAGGSSFMAALHDLVADPGDMDEPDTEPRLVDTEPAMAELLTKASVNSVKNTLQLARGTLRTTGELAKYARAIMREEIPAPDVSAPKTVLNKSVGPHRVFDAAEFPLEGFKDIKNATGVTVNDVALGVVGGALARYLEAKGELPEEGSLAAALPLNMRTRRSMTDDNNQVGSVFASLHSDIKDPLERLAAIKESTAEAKISGESSPMVDAMMLAGVLSPAVTKTQLFRQNNPVGVGRSGHYPGPGVLPRLPGCSLRGAVRGRGAGCTGAQQQSSCRQGQDNITPAQARRGWHCAESQDQGENQDQSQSQKSIGGSEEHRSQAQGSRRAQAGSQDRQRGEGTGKTQSRGQEQGPCEAQSSDERSEGQGEGEGEGQSRPDSPQGQAACSRKSQAQTQGLMISRPDPDSLGHK